MRLGFHALPCLLAGGTLLLCSVTAARADYVTDWNVLALTTMRDSSDAAPVMARDLAILSTAMYNAAESIRGGYQTFGAGSYTAPGAGPAGASYQAAMISAANTVMQSLYSGSSASFTSLYNTQLGTIADSQAKADGVAWGAAVANNFLTWRAGDGASAAASTPYTPVGTVGYWQQTSPSSALLPGWGNVNTFALPGTAGYQQSLPGGVSSYLVSSQYAADYNQVKDLGTAFSLTRTADQTNQAYFWAAGAGTVTSVGMWNQVAQTAAAGAGLSDADTARLFAAMNMAMADAGITAFATAYDMQFWRPETAIANGDIDGNAGTNVDTSWAPLITSPSMPEYAALGSALSGAAATVLASYLGDNTAFSLGSDINGDGTTDLTRSFTSFSQAAAEATQSGIYGGTQFATSATDGQALGSDVAGYIIGNHFALVPEPSSALLLLCGVLLALHRRSRA